MSTQYHVLVVGFELEKRGREGDTRKTDLRHYRYDTTTYSMTPENNAWVVKNGKTFVAAFPVPNTMILVEEVDVQK